MKHLLFLFFSTVLAQSAFAFPSHTGFCRCGEDCDGIVSQDIYEAQRICRQDVFDKLAKAVYQAQCKGGPAVFVGYVCVSEPN
jgi:hypothetical protein